jgi:hypothetical protein
VIGSAVVPTLIANAFFLPHHLISKADATPANVAIDAHAPVKISAADEVKR